MVGEALAGDAGILGRLRAGGPARGRAEPPQHRRGPRHRDPRGVAVRGHRAARGRDPPGAAVARPGLDQPGTRLDRTDRPCALRRPRPRHRPPRPQARERVPHPRRPGEAPRLRHRQVQPPGDRGPRVARPDRQPGRLGDPHRLGAGNAGLHVPRAGPWGGARPEKRHLRPGNHPPRAALRAAHLPGRVNRRERLLHPPRRPAAAPAGGSRGRGAAGAAVPGQGPRAALPVRAGRGLRARGAPWHRRVHPRRGVPVSRRRSQPGPAAPRLARACAAARARGLPRGARRPQHVTAAPDPPADLPSRHRLRGPLRLGREDGALQRRLERRAARAVHHRRRLARLPRDRGGEGPPPRGVERRRFWRCS